MRVLIALLVLAAAPAGAEPLLRLERAADDALLATWSQDPGDEAALAWNLYRGDLGFVGFGTHRGGPWGRCSLPTAPEQVLLEGESALRASFYYVLTRFDPDATERDLGLTALGDERAHQYPCRYQSACPGGGPAVRPEADWGLLEGRVPAVQLPPPASFTATNRDGTPRGPDDLRGAATVLWFYPVAAGSS